jgi:LTXXQ motif family protein
MRNAAAPVKQTEFPMYKSTKILSALLLAGVAATAAFAQTAPGAAPGAAPGPAGEPGRGMKRERPSPETMQRMQEGKIAGALATLKLNETQLKLWAPVEAQIRARHAERAKMMEEWANRKQGDARPSMTERMTKMGEMMGKRAEKAKAFAAVFGPFEASLTEDQKKVIGPVMADLSGGHGKRGMGGHGGGHRWGMQRGGGQPG